MITIYIFFFKALSEDDLMRKVNNFYVIVRIYDKKRIKRYFF